MVVRWGHVTEQKINGVYRSEYTVDCGWLDWSHALPGRDDIKTIWGDLPPQTTQSKPDIRLRDRTVKNEYSYWKVRVPQLDGASIAKTDVWYVKAYGMDVRNDHSAEPDDLTGPDPVLEAQYYKSAALTLYEISCRAVEQRQDDKLKDIAGNTGFSMEDLVSNLLAFYGHVEGLDRKALVKECGGWPDPKKAADKSKEVYEALDDDDIVLDPFDGAFEQPKAKDKSFREAYLFNDKLKKITKDRRSGWHRIPDFFHSILPVLFYGDYAGSKIVSSEGMEKLKQTHDVIASNIGEQNYPMNQRYAQRSSTGRGLGRTPGPAGVNRMA